jgi:cysteinyl-tRNA synthetase
LPHYIYRMEHPLKLHNTLTREKELFEPLNPPFVGMYVCGPTVYSDVHLGNCRTFISFDVLYRYLLFRGYKVRYVRNVTDAGHLESDADEGEDKIAKKARMEKLEPMEIVQRYTVDFHKVMEAFNALPPSIEPTATGHIIEQIEMTKHILANGYGYEADDAIYFDVEKLAKEYPYGKLSGRNLDDLLENTRDLEGQESKRGRLDFALLKKAKPTHIMQWPSPWGPVFPGWHLECSAMSCKYLGEEFDIHGGGMDLIPTHHTNEIAQNVAVCRKNPARFWVHTNMLTVQGQKMSKSLGNSFLPRELFTGAHPLLERGYSPMTVRFFMLQAHYRSTLDFSNVAIQAAEKGLQRLMNAFDILEKLAYPTAKGNPNEAEIKEVNTLLDECYDMMSDDLNTAETIARLFELSKKINSYNENKIPLTTLDEKTFLRLKEIFPAFIRDVLGLKSEGKGDSGVTDGLMNLVLELRKDVRAKKDFASSDKIRDELVKIGIVVKDSKEGTTWTIN